MTELEIKILANKTYDSMVSQMRNIPGTTDKEIDIFMDKFTKNLREILIENNPEDDTKSFKEELIEKEIQNRAADKLYKTVFDRAEPKCNCCKQHLEALLRIENMKNKSFDTVPD